MMGCKNINKFAFLNEIIDEVCSKVKKMKLISFCLTFEVYSKSLYIDPESLNKLSAVLLEYSYIVNKLSYKDFIPLFIFITNTKIEHSLRKELFGHFWEKIEHHL